MIRALFDLLMLPIDWVFEKAFRVVTTQNTPTDDPDYKKNVQRLIERNREFEKPE